MSSEVAIPNNVGRSHDIIYSNPLGVVPSCNILSCSCGVGSYSNVIGSNPHFALTPILGRSMVYSVKEGNSCEYHTYMEG